MFRSILRYGDYLIKIPFRKDGSYLIDDMARFVVGRRLARVPEYQKQVRDRALDDGINWLLQAQEKMQDDGFGSYHLVEGWGTSYPETTGYIIPTLLNYASRTDQLTIRHQALSAADWLLTIQKSSGGWQAKRMADNQPEVVFNTGQVIRGMIAAWHATSKETYLEAATRAGDWIISVQHPEGYWQKYASMEKPRVYDSYVDVPLLQLSRLTNNEKYKEAAEKNLEWITSTQLQSNGWFENCDNTVKHNDRPIIHTLGYTLDGLIESGILLDRDDLVEAARPGALALMKDFLDRGVLFGRYDKEWRGSEYFICTGGAQLAIIWLKLYRQTLEECFQYAGGRMLDVLIHIQQRRIRLSKNVKGAIPGSYPVWGKYEPFAFPNWATKFFADALMMFD